MDNSIKTLFSFLISKDEKIGTKLLFSFFILILILLLNNVFGFSFFYNSEKKIDQLTKINTVLQDSTLEPDFKNKVLQLREDIVNRKNVFEYFSTLKIRKSTSKSTIEYLDSNKHLILNFISSSWYFIFIIIAFVFKSFKERDFDFIQLIISLFFGLILFGAGLASSYLTNLIPIIYSKAIWINYIVNVFLVLIIFYPLIKLDFQNLTTKY